MDASDFVNTAAMQMAFGVSPSAAFPPASRWIAAPCGRDTSVSRDGQAGLNECPQNAAEQKSSGGEPNACHLVEVLFPFLGYRCE